MSTQREQFAAISHAIATSESRLKQLDAKASLTRAEVFERDMIIDTITRGCAILGIPAPTHQKQAYSPAKPPDPAPMREPKRTRKGKPS